MVADIANYAGREQAYVKHYFLESYLERLIHKTAGSYDEIVYVDGFSGPWQSHGQNFEDTSFGIALAALRSAKAQWKKLGRDVRVSALLVEKSKSAYKKLSEIGARFPDVEIQTYNDDFTAISARLLAAIPSKAFAFVLIDPKGWRIDIEQLRPLLARPHSEVVFNFMFDFINRAASMNEPQTVAGINALILGETWREHLRAVGACPDASTRRKKILTDAFRETVTGIGNYTYVAEIPVFRPLKDRTLYSLIYATRHPAGIEVFRECQIKTLQTQDTVRTAAKRAHNEASTGQSELFDASVEMKPNEIAGYLASEEQAAAVTLLALAPRAPATATYREIWPRVLSAHAVKRTTVNRIAAGFRKSGQLNFLDWAANKKVPDDTYRLSKP